MYIIYIYLYSWDVNQRLTSSNGRRPCCALPTVQHSSVFERGEYGEHVPHQNQILLHLLFASRMLQVIVQHQLRLIPVLDTASKLSTACAGPGPASSWLVVGTSLELAITIIVCNRSTARTLRHCFSFPTNSLPS